MAIRVLAEKKQNHCEIARTFGVSEGAVRYHLRRKAEGTKDGRKEKPYKAAVVADAIDAWVRTQQEDSKQKRPVNVRELYEHLVAEHDYEGHYRSVLRFVRARYPRPRMRTYRRIETPPGAQVQTDWGEYPQVDVGSGSEPLHAFVMVLSHSRMPAVVWSRSENQVSWLSCHNEAFRRLAGIAAVNRIDNVKTAIATGAGAWGVIHPTYRAYSRAVGFHIDACQPREANAKGKAEAKVRLSRLRVSPNGRRFDALEELQERTDRRIRAWAEKAICPATGKTIVESWEQELERLRPLPLLPEPFDVVVTRPVNPKGCTVPFEGRDYAVPFTYADQRVEVRGCAGKVQILADAVVIREYPRGTPERILLDTSCYEGEATDRVLPPPPLGKMGRRLEEIMALPVEQRPLDLYAELAEVAR